MENDWRNAMPLRFLMMSAFLIASAMPADAAEPAIQTETRITGAPQKNALGIKKGSYLRSDYIDRIEKTHSPYATEDLFLQPTLLKAYQGEFDLVLIHGFQEFYDGLNITGDGKVYRGGYESKEYSNVSITVDGDDLILTGYETRGPLHYIYVEDEQPFIAKNVLVGDYFDSEGKNYSFGEDMNVSLGDVQFVYEIGLNFVERPKDHKMRDYFQNKVSRELYEFEINDGVISIYRTSGDRFEIVEPEPFLKLRRVGR